MAHKSVRGHPHRSPGHHSQGDAMAANAGMSDYSSKGLRHVSTKSNYHVDGIGVKDVGEYAATAHRRPAAERMGALEQMSNGSMNYLSREDAKFAKNVKRIHNQALDYDQFAH